MTEGWSHTASEITQSVVTKWHEFLPVFCRDWEKLQQTKDDRIAAVLQTHVQDVPSLNLQLLARHGILQSFQVNSRHSKITILHFCGGLLKWHKIHENVKPSKHRSYGHLASTILKMCEIVENAKYRNVKLRIYCSTLQQGTNAFFQIHTYLPLIIDSHSMIWTTIICQTAVRFGQYLQQSVQSYSLWLFAPTTVSSPSKLSSWSQK